MNGRDIENNEIYREVFCPLCKKIFTASVSKSYDCTIGSEKDMMQGWTAYCSFCQTELFFEEQIIEGIPLGIFSEGEIHKDQTGMI